MVLLPILHSMLVGLMKLFACVKHSMVWAQCWVLSMANAYLEITGGLFPPHVYLLEGNNLIAYIRAGHTDPFYFKQPIKGFSKSGRKFEPASMAAFTVTEPLPNIKTVMGSKGETYIVDMDAGTCTCAGYTFRGACKHTKELA